MTNTITVVNEQDKGIIMGVLGGKMAQDIEFEQLDAQIEVLANNSKKLTDTERENAVTYIDRFKDRVLSRICNKANSLINFKSAITFDDMSVYKFDDTVNHNKNGDKIITALFEREGMEDILVAYEKAKELLAAYNEYKEGNKPEEPFYDEFSMTGAEIQQAKMKYNMDYGLYNLQVNKNEYKVKKALFELAKVARKNAEYKKFMRVLAAQSTAANEAKAIAEEKADAAKIAILISHDSIRKALKALHNFSATV